MPGRQSEDQIKRRAIAAGAAMASDLALSQAIPVQPGTARAPAALEACLSQIDIGVAQSFTAEQLRALEIMLEQRRTKRHKISWQTGVSWGGKRYYLSLFFGRDRRGLVRPLAVDGQAELEANGGGRGLLVWVLLTPLLIGAAYMGARLAGVDLAMLDLVNRFFA